MKTCSQCSVPPLPPVCPWVQGPAVVIARAGVLLIALMMCLTPGRCAADEMAAASSRPSGPTARQVEQFGITWTFDKEYPVGQFANGDWWVVGPVTIVKIDPASTKEAGRVRNGSMVNPTPKNGTRQGYDSAMYRNYAAPDDYDPKLNVARPNDRDLSAENPLVLPPGSSLVSSVSVPKANARPQLRTAAILTVLKAPAPEGSFRPAYSSADKTIRFNRKQLDYARLGKLKPPEGEAPRIKQKPDDKQDASMERMFERPWLDHVNGWTQRYASPLDNMPGYHRDRLRQVSLAALALQLDMPNEEKETLAIRLAQTGIDIYGDIQNGGRGYRGSGRGRKFQVLFAGVMLGDKEMMDIGRRGVKDYGPSHPDYVYFGEDIQTFYVGDDEILDKPYELRGHTRLPYATETGGGTVKVTRGSRIVEGQGTKWQSWGSPETRKGKNKTRFFGIVDDNQAHSPCGRPYEIARIIDATHLELTFPYTGDDAEGKAYKIGAPRLVYGHGDQGKRIDVDEYTDKHRGMPEWSRRHGTPNITFDGLSWEAPYRTVATGFPGYGMALAAHIMGLKELWNHDAFFDYIDRLVAVDDRLRDYGGFPMAMWQAYREKYPPVYTADDLTLNIEARHGSVKVSPEKKTYRLGEKVTLTAVPDAGYEFVSWDVPSNHHPIGWKGSIYHGANRARASVTIVMHAHLYVAPIFLAVSADELPDTNRRPAAGGPQ